MSIAYIPYDSEWVAALRAGGPDAYGRPAEHAISDGGGNPCRHCLHDIPKGKTMLICAGRPFPEAQPYAETGPIFFCADDCAPYDKTALPPVLEGRKSCLMKGYSDDNRIIYGTGKIVPPEVIEQECESLFSDADVAYVDIRSATNNCFTFRITRAA